MAALENLDTLAEQLYREGMQKAEAASAELLDKSNKEAEAIVATAKKEAEQVLKNAEKEARKKQLSVESELKQKSRQVLEELKVAITNLIVSRILSDPLKDSLDEKAFVKDLISSSMQVWKERQDIELWLPSKFEELRDPLQKMIGAQLPKLTIHLTEQLANGFQIENKEEGYILNFSDKDFEALLRPHLSNAVNKMLFEKGP